MYNLKMFCVNVTQNILETVQELVRDLFCVQSENVLRECYAKYFGNCSRTGSSGSAGISYAISGKKYCNELKKRHAISGQNMKL